MTTPNTDSNQDNIPKYVPPSNVSTNKPTNTIVFNKNYLLSLHGIIRIILIVAEFAAWVAEACAWESPTRSAFLFFFITGFFISIFIFVLHILNIVHFTQFESVPIILIVTISNVVYGLTFFILAIVSAVAEGQLNQYNVYGIYGLNYYYHYNRGAYAAGAFFGFVCVLLLIVDTAFHVKRLVRENINVKPPSA